MENTTNSSIWDELFGAMKEFQLGFFIALICGYGFFRFMKRKISEDTGEGNIVIGDGDDDYKMVLVVRNDLKMGKGKVAAQCAHAAVAGFEAVLKHPKLLQEWSANGHKKITLKVDSEKELNEINKAAKKVGLIAITIQDAGRTQIAAGSKTVCCVGPGPSEIIDQVTGHLKLY